MEISAFRLSAPTTGQIIILIIVVFVISIAFFIATRRAGVGRTQKRGKATGTGWRNFYQIAKLRGLSKHETEILRKLVLAYGLTKPTLVFTSTAILDSCIQRAVRRVSLREVRGDSKADIINLYYRIRNKVTRNRAIKGITSTQAIPVGAKLRVEIPHVGYFTVSVVKNEPNCFGISIPSLSPTRTVGWGRQKLICSYWRENDAAYSFETRISEVIINEEGQYICLKHSNKVSRIQKRRYPRKNVRLPVLFSRIRVIEQEGKKKAIVDRRDSHWGTIIDISVGGLSIETTSPIDKNNYIKVEFELREEYKVVAYGKVRRIERNPLRKNWIMHIQFTKINKQYKNEIFAVLYNYETI